MISGKVIKGDGLGKTFGFPTANLNISEFDYENNQGVYAGYAFLKNIKYPVAIAILFVPNKFEVQFLDLVDFPDFYDEEVQVEILERVSEIEKFEDKKDLIQKIGQDVEKIREILK